jgi:hypothetical protein
MKRGGGGVIFCHFQLAIKMAAMSRGVMRIMFLMRGH